MAALEYRFAQLELRQDGRRLIGTAVRYGEIATLPFGNERFEPGAFAPIGDAILNVQHDRGRPLARTFGGGLVLHDTESELRIEAALPATREAEDALALVKAGVLRGLSIEFHARQERQDGNVRVIERAALSGVAVVDSGAYPGSTVEARRRGDRGGRLGSYRFQIPAGQTLDCKCGPNDCDAAVIESGALDKYLAPEAQRRLLAAWGDFSRPLASVRGGGLRFWSDGKGGMYGAVDVPNSDLGRQVMDAYKAVPDSIVARPIVDPAASVSTVSAGVATYSDVTMRGVGLAATDQTGGWPILEAIEKAAAEAVEKTAPAPARRARLWL